MRLGVRAPHAMGVSIKGAGRPILRVSESFERGQCARPGRTESCSWFSSPKWALKGAVDRWLPVTKDQPDSYSGCCQLTLAGRILETRETQQERASRHGWRLLMPCHANSVHGVMVRAWQDHRLSAGTGEGERLGTMPTASPSRPLQYICRQDLWRSTPEAHIQFQANSIVITCRRLLSAY